jgi:hypothetical protein
MGLAYAPLMRGNLGLFVGGADRARLAAIAADRNSPQKHVWRAEVVLLTAERRGTAEIMRRGICPSPRSGAGRSATSRLASKGCCATGPGRRGSQR